MVRLGDADLTRVLAPTSIVLTRCFSVSNARLPWVAVVLLDHAPVFSEMDVVAVPRSDEPVEDVSLLAEA
jgi:hypothetical protein